MADTEYYGVHPEIPKEVERRYTYKTLVGQTFFPAVYTIGYVDVYYNGVHLDPSEFDATDGQNVVIPGAAYNSSVAIVCRRQIKTYSGSSVDDNIVIDSNGTKVLKLKIEEFLTASLPPASPDNDGRIVLENAGTSDRNLVIYAGGLRFRIDGGSSF